MIYVRRREFFGLVGAAAATAASPCWLLEAVAGPRLPRVRILSAPPWQAGAFQFVERRLYPSGCEVMADALQRAASRPLCRPMPDELFIPFRDLAERTRFWDTLTPRMLRHPACIEIYRVAAA